MKYDRITGITVLLGAVLVLSVYGQTSVFTYQGRLSDGGAPASGQYDLTFTLYDAETGGSSLGTAGKPGTEVSDGLFMVELDFGGSAFNGADRWLEISAATNGGAASLLSPRQQITSAPYAIKAGDAGTLGGYIPNDFAPDTHGHTGDDISAGTVASAYIDSAIARDSEITWGNLTGIPADIADGDQVGLLAEVDPQVGGNTANYVPRWNGSALVSGSIYDNGSIGIGTGGAALDKLEVAGNLSLSAPSGSGRALRFRQGGTNYWTLFTAPWLQEDDLRIRRETASGLGNKDVMVFDQTTGNVGIHTVTPEAALHVNGDLKVSGNIISDNVQTGHVSVAAAAFHPSADTTSYNNTGQYVYPASPTVTYFYAGVCLPHGAAVTSVQWDGVSSGEGSFARLRLNRSTITGSTAAMAECFFSGSGVFDLTDTSISNATVDNSQYAYYLEMYLNEAGGPASGGAVLITYTYPGP